MFTGWDEFHFLPVQSLQSLDRIRDGQFSTRGYYQSRKKHKRWHGCLHKNVQWPLVHVCCVLVILLTGMILPDGIIQIFDNKFVKPTTKDIFLSFRQFSILPLPSSIFNHLITVGQILAHQKCSGFTLTAPTQDNKLLTYRQDRHIVVSHLRDRFTTATTCSTACRRMDRNNRQISDRSKRGRR